ncbi:hypothetical protein BH11CYA1_BH11CYA1_09560 [soil metagenome]
MHFTLKIALTLSLALSAGLQLTAWADATVDNAILEANNYRRNHNSREALAVLQSVEKQATNNAAFLAERGAVYVALDQYAAAMKDCNLAIKLDPKISDAYDRRAFCWTVSNQLDKAIADYTTAIKLNPLSPMPYHNRAIAYRKLGKLKLANADMKHYLTLRPAREVRNEASVHHNAALTKEKDGDIKGAINYLKYQVQDDSPASLPLHLGKLYAQSGDMTNGMKFTNQAVGKADKDKDTSVAISARIFRARLLCKQRDFNAAIKDCSEAAELSNKTEPVSALKIKAKGEHALALTLRAECYLETKKPDLAMADVNQVIKQNPDLIVAYETRGAIYLASGKQYKEAIADYSKVLKNFPNSVKSRMGRAEAYSATKQYKEAIKDYTIAIEKSPSEASDAYGNRAKIYRILHEDKKAAADLLKAHQAKPD